MKKIQSAILILTLGGLLHGVRAQTSDHLTLLSQRSSKGRFISQIENHKPLFTNCSGYNPQLEEGKPKGTFVIDVKAEDLNSPDEPNGQISYTILNKSDQSLFEIDERSGRIKTNWVFDRDESKKSKELYVTVKATDHGRPPLADICLFKVTILDINDNTPVFDQASYAIEVSEDLPIGSEVVRVLAYDFDDGENARLSYSLDPLNGKFNEYFRINDERIGTIKLIKAIGKTEDFFSSFITVRDHGVPPLQSTAEIQVKIIGSSKKPPTISASETVIEVKENMNNFSKTLITLTANSNIDDEQIAFQIVRGKTMQTNKANDFVLANIANTTADIRIGRALDYETTTEYQLTIRAQNKISLVSTINIIIKVLDVNDEIPSFLTNSLSGSVVENSQPGQNAMTVRAIDKDGTKPNNDVFYELTDLTDLFEIDRISGVVTTKVEFDREAENGKSYFINIRAYDGAPSALFETVNKPNEQIERFQVMIEDQNDNRPEFTQSLYIANDVSEGANVGQIVIEVKATDNDTAALIVYSIIEGDDNHEFAIDETTGVITVSKKLDFEKIEMYNLTVKAWDGIYEDTAKVHINIANENDEQPVFDKFGPIEIFEEQVSDECIVTLKAYDPDIKDRSADQGIVYEVLKGTSDFLTVSQDGCVKVIKKLDRDPPKGTPWLQGFITAYDNNNVDIKLDAYAELNITLIDINDNAPFLKTTQVVYYENQPPTFVMKLDAIDYDTVENGPPFIFELADEALADKFKVSNGELFALATFDREEFKFYDVRIRITDSGAPPQSDVSTLRVVIGDRNDNAARDGASAIFVSKFAELDRAVEIGRVFVDDPDDWDLPDKTFIQDSPLPDFFSVDLRGMVTMEAGAPAAVYELTFKVTEAHEPAVPRHTVRANVTVHVTEIPREAVVSSGSVRLSNLTKEAFVERDARTGLSRRDLLQLRLAQLYNITPALVDVFTVLSPVHAPQQVDVRFSAHGSPYYAAERLNHAAARLQPELQRELALNISMVGVNECLVHNCQLQGGCRNVLNISKEPAVVFTNRTSFVGVRAESVAECTTCAESLVCTDNARCEGSAIGFNEAGWAMYPAWDMCRKSVISFDITTLAENGLIFYAGPMTRSQAGLVADFIAMEVAGGYAIVKMDLGNGSFTIENRKKLINDGGVHTIRLSVDEVSVEVKIDDSSANIEWEQINESKMGLLEIGGPLQVGGRVALFGEEEAKQVWAAPPTGKGLIGCVRSFTHNARVYDLGAPADGWRATPDCNFGVAQAVTLGIDPSFLVAILVCVAILLILLLAVVVHKRQQDNQNEKDLDDTRENIINYEDEGGGECDTNFDLTVFRNNKYDEKALTSEPVSDDINTFLEAKKRACDKDNLPYDDVRHYGYEGDGNTSGSLSSLASGTDDTDCDMNYLSSFGPRFRKLADMYGDDASEEDNPNCDGESWC